MFNGIVEAIGTVETLINQKDCLYFSIAPNKTFNDLKIGDSVSVNGICLTITDVTSHSFNVTVVPETLRKSNLRELSIGSLVNLERAMKVEDRIHGHFIQGHSDGVGNIIEIIDDGKETLLIKIAIPENLNKYVVNKGYIALDGMSITVIDVTNDWFSATIIPETRKSSIANSYHVGSTINIETDIVGKYIEKFFAEKHHASSF